MESEINVQDEIKLRLTPMAEQYMLAATRWAKFLAILGFIVAGIMLIFSLSIGAIMSLATSMNPAAGAGFAAVPVGIISGVYITISALYFAIAFYMYHFASKTQSGILKRDEYLVEAGFKAFKTQLTIMGVLAVIGISMILLAFVIAIIAGIAASAS